VSHLAWHFCAAGPLHIPSTNRIKLFTRMS
jgi:hypothetical protein